MKRIIVKRLSLGILQHILAACMTLALGGLLLNSYIAVDSIDGRQIYEIFPVDVGVEFEESEIYHDLFRSAVSDITQLVAIKDKLETNGVLDPSKRIDVTKYAAQIGEDQDCAVTVEYELDNLIKWGKAGVEYTNRFMSMSEFVSYFGNCIYPENFTLNEYGELCFDDFYHVGDETPEEGSENEGNGEMQTQETQSLHGKTEEEIAMLSERLGEYTRDQLEDFVFSYIMSENLNHIELYREDDGSLMVCISMLNCRYATVDGGKQLTGYVNNWIDYTQLQDNVAAVVNSIILNYQRYQVCNEAYKEGSSNVIYMVRMMTDNGICTYTNRAELLGFDDDDVTEAFNEYRRYLIYYPDSLVFMGNTILSEEELDEYISIYDYAYPDTTHIWLGMDSNYSTAGDAFYNANAVYQRIVPNVNRIIALIVVLAVIWLALGIYLTISAGTIPGENGRQTWYLNRFDRIWTEALLLLAAGLCWGALYGYRTLMEIIESAGDPSQLMGIQLTRLYRYTLFGLYGLYLSLAFNLIWYSLTRRIKAGSLWSDSFLHYFCRGIGNSVRFIFRHRNSVVSTLLPYNAFLFINLAGIATVYQLREQRLYMAAVLTGMVILDGIVGVLLFRYKAEQDEIVEGIKRIRDGEVEFKLESASLHGAGRELADAVNNIGEGIRKAVKTSMKDEQMKTDLITNVSHDIKTPLTSIINYVDLLKRMKIEEEPARGYIEILDGKAQRHKQLTDDLVEASKISSGSIVLEKEKLNLTELIHQGIGEYSEKLEENRLQVVFEQGDTPSYIYADSRRMWRVVENLFNNIHKYALEGTRIYIDMAKKENRVEVSIKNISRQQMNIRPEELTERFIRGDSSRTTEGSGLGLSIAKSLVQVQEGNFEIHLDGDLFKVVISFPEYSSYEEKLQA